MNDVAASGDIEKMEAVEMRQELEMRMAERQAKVAAIAQIQQLPPINKMRSPLKISPFHATTGDTKIGAKQGQV